MTRRSTEPLLSVEGLRVSYRRGGFPALSVEVLHGVDLEVRPGETVGLVGESGSGKSTIGRAILGLVEPSAGRIVFDGEDIAHLPRRRRRGLARDLQVVFQDPYTSLNPALEVGDILAEPLIAQGRSSRDAHAVVGRLLDRVHLPADSGRRLSREFSGGQRQRIAIARALAVEPRLIVCDEPVSALDLTTQRTVLDLLVEVQEATGVSYLFISHDLAVVRAMSHRVSVLRSGEVVETGSADAITAHPTHEYTRRLVLSSPVADPDEQLRRRELLDSLR